MESLGEIVTRLAPRLGPPSGSPVPLDGGITNRNYRMRFGGQDYVIRFPGKDTHLLAISRESERIAGAVAAKLGIAPELVATEPDCTVTRFLKARPVPTETLKRDPSGVARALRAFHDSGVRLPTVFWVPDLLERYRDVVRSRGGEVPEAFEHARRVSDRVGQALALSDPVPCHNDLLGANLLALEGDEPRTVLVDWEYAGMGHRLFDLGNLAVNNGFDAAAEERLLAAYFGAPPAPAQRAALALMRIMSDAREAGWGVVQGAISELDFDFGGYARNHFERLTAAASGPRFEEWLDAAAA